MIEDLNVIESMINSNENEAIDALIAFSKHLVKNGLTLPTTHLYTKILSKNIKEASDIIFGEKKPERFFSTIPANKNLLQFAFGTLAQYNANQLNQKICKSCLGIILNAYASPHNGYKIYPISVSDIYHMSKFLQNNEESSETLILDILEKLNKGQIESCSVLAGKIVNYWFDNSKTLNQIIPEIILTNP